MKTPVQAIGPGRRRLIYRRIDRANPKQEARRRGTANVKPTRPALS